MKDHITRNTLQMRGTNKLTVNKDQSSKRLHLRVSTFKAPERTSETLGMRPSFARTEPKMPADQRHKNCPLTPQKVKIKQRHKISSHTIAMKYTHTHIM